MEPDSAARDLSALLEKRATCRSFRPDPIPEDVMEKLIAAACTSASAGGFQRMSVVVVRSPEKKKRLAELSRNQSFVAQAPANFVFCIDHRRMRRIAEYEASPCDAADSIASLWMGIVDATIAAQSMALAAEALGLGSCYNGNVIEMPRELTELLCLPRGVAPAIMLTVGYPEKAAKPSRKYAPRAMVHEEAYCDLPMEELYAEHKKKFPGSYSLSDARRENLRRAALAQGGEAFAERCLAAADASGKLTAYQFWFGCFYHDESRPEAEGAEYLDYLEEQGFHVRG